MNSASKPSIVASAFSFKDARLTIFDNWRPSYSFEYADKLTCNAPSMKVLFKPTSSTFAISGSKFTKVGMSVVLNPPGLKPVEYVA